MTPASWLPARLRPEQPARRTLPTCHCVAYGARRERCGQTDYFPSFLDSSCVCLRGCERLLTFFFGPKFVINMS